MNGPPVKRLAIFMLLVVAPPALAHPVPSFTYDRTVRVRLTSSGVEVAYRLELNDFTILRDIDKLVDDDTFATLNSPARLRSTFADAIGPFLADRLDARLGGQLLTFHVAASSMRLDDHLYFDFTLLAPWVDSPTGVVSFALEVGRAEQREEIHLEKGRLDLAFEPTASFVLARRVEPTEELKNRPEAERGVEDDSRLRRIAATIAPTGIVETSEPPLADEVVLQVPSLWRRGPAALLESHLGLGMLLILAGAFGAAHALTPGHGKTLVAAYLVGQRGTVGHAFLLGLVTTITHTGIVILLAAMLPLILTRVAPEKVQAILGFVGGLLVAAMGLWLLLRRLAGQADHVHVGVGGGHHHHHGPGGNHHHHHLPIGDRVRVWDLIVLGVSGGIVPCWDAIALLAMAIGTKKTWLGLPLLLAFSAGLAGVLVLIGVLVVKVKGFGTSRRGEGRFIKALPVLSALAVMLLGLWLCFEAVRASS